MKAILGLYLMIVVTVVTSQDAENPQQNTKDVDDVVIHFLDYKRDEVSFFKFFINYFVFNH
jgi:hypothetical protein